MEPIAFGRYSLIRRIAQGGMAQIYLAVQRGPHGFEKVAVLKVILPELCSNDDFVKMFLDEARIAANLDHTNVVRVYDFGEVDGQYFIAMEHLPGEDLASILQANKRANRRMPTDTAADMILGAATGLHFAHELKDARGRLMNMVHRDVSPSNIIVTYQGIVKLVDFGIARAETNVTKTEAGTLKGKVAYVSPEQASGEPLDRRSDVWALGVVLYELLTGQRIFRRDSDLATLKAVAEGTFPPPRELRPEMPKPLEAIVLKAMTRELSQRYQSAGEMADDLAGYLVGQGYVRSERQLAAYMDGLFDAERRDAKLLISRTASVDSGPVLATPSQLKHLPQHLSPLRSHPTLPALELEPSTTDEPTFVRERRRRAVVMAISLIAVGIAVAVGLAYRPQLEAAFAPQVIAEAPKPKPPEPEAQPAKPPEPEAVKPPEPAQVVPPTPAPSPSPSPAPPEVKPKKAAKGKLTLDSVPWAEVFLNGKKLGDTPLVEYPLPVGFHVLKLVNTDRGLKSSIEVEIVAGKTTTKKLKL